MQFVYPYFLFSLFAVAIPIIIHLFNFRRFRKIFFTNVKFIQDLKLETRKRFRLKHILALIARILAIAALCFAFAQPYIPLTGQDPDRQGNRSIGLYVDNSFSMEAKSEQGELLEVAKNRAMEIVSAYNPSDLFQVITNDFEARHQRLVSAEEAIELINEIDVSPITRELSEIAIRMDDIVGNSATGIRDVFFVSDFQKSVSDIHLLPNDTSVSGYLLPVLANQTNNLYIDSAWFESPVMIRDQNMVLKFRVRNFGPVDYEKIPVRLMINDNQKSLSSFDIQGNGSAEVVMNFTSNTAGIHHAKLELTDYPVTFDDIFYFSFDVKQSIPVLIVNGKNASGYLEAFFKIDSAFTFSTISVNRLDYSSFPDYNMVILNEIDKISTGLMQELKKVLEDGSTVLIVPSTDIDLESYNQLLSGINAPLLGQIDTTDLRISDLNLESAVFEDVFETKNGSLPANIDLPLVNYHYPLLIKSVTNQETIIGLQDGEPFFTSTKFGKGLLYLLSVSLSEKHSNFARHAIFVPAMFRIALLSSPFISLYYTVGRDEVVYLRSIQYAESYKMRNVLSRDDFIPESRRSGSSIALNMHSQVNMAGNYDILSDNEKLAGLSFNYMNHESNLLCYTPAELTTVLENNGLTAYSVISTGKKPLADILRELNMGVKLWKLFILLGLAFLLIEVLILRFMK